MILMPHRRLGHVEQDNYLRTRPTRLEPHCATQARAAIWEVDPRTGQHRIFASGLRNPVGLAWEPVTGALWTSVNERDEIGSDLVPDYMTTVKEGAFYGWPYSYYGQHVDVRVKPQRPAAKTATAARRGRTTGVIRFPVLGRYAGVLPADYFFEPVLSAFSTSAGSTPEITPSNSVASSAAAGTPTFPADILAAPESAVLSAESGTACAAAWKPIFEWVPSQKGFFVDAPQRQSTVLACAGMTFPLVSCSSIVPVTTYGPFGLVSIVTSAMNNPPW